MTVFSHTFMPAAVNNCATIEGETWWDVLLNLVVAGGTVGLADWRHLRHKMPCYSDGGRCQFCRVGEVSADAFRDKCSPGVVFNVGLSVDFSHLFIRCGAPAFGLLWYCEGDFEKSPCQTG